MAKKRGNSALLCLLGFVPFASTYLMGELAGGLRLGKAKIEVEVGEVSGSLRKGYSKIKHFGLFVMIAELILCIGYAVQDIPQSVIFMNPDLYEVRPVASGNLTYLAVFFAESVPAWLVTTMNFFSIFCTIFYFIWLVLFIFLCMSFFRTYAPASYIWMVVLCAIIPVLTGFLIFAFRNRDPIDYDKYMQERMERIRRAQQAQYGPYGGNPYGNPYGQNPYGRTRTEPLTVRTATAVRVRRRNRTTRSANTLPPRPQTTAETAGERRTATRSASIRAEIPAKTETADLCIGGRRRVAPPPGLLCKARSGCTVYGR